MENFINQENLEDIRELIESKIANIPGEAILIGAIGTLLLSTYLSKKGNTKAASLVGKLAIPIVGIGIAKYKDLIKSQIETFQDSAKESLSNTTDSVL
jgi:hypothetical protein